MRIVQFMGKTLGDKLADPPNFLADSFRAVANLNSLTLVARARLLDLLDDGPIAIADMAERSGMHAHNLERLFTYLTSQGVVEMDAEGRVSHTPQSRTLQSLRSAIIWQSMTLEAGLEFEQAFRSDKTGFEHRYGREVFDYFANNPDIASVFADVMTYSTKTIESFIFNSHQFEPFECAVDVGGNHGSLLIRLLASYPGTRGILFDLPETVAEAGNVISSSGLADRIEIVGGDFFQSVPSDGDLYLLKFILHDWSDDECVAILRKVREAITNRGRLVVIDVVLPEENVEHPLFYWDMNMMTMTAGRERRLSQFKTLFQRSGFCFDRITENPNGQSVVEAIPAQP